MPRERRKIPSVDPKLLIKDTAKLLPDPSRRLFLRGAARLGALATLTRCEIIDAPPAAGARRAAAALPARRRESRRARHADRLRHHRRADRRRCAARRVAVQRLGPGPP